MLATADFFVFFLSVLLLCFSVCVLLSTVVLIGELTITNMTRTCHNIEHTVSETLCEYTCN